MKIAERFSKPSQVCRILMIQLGDIGDVVWFLPALRAVSEAYPEAIISILLREGNGSLLAADRFPLKIFEVQKGIRESLLLIRALRREKIDLVIDVRGHERGAYMAFLTGAPIRVGLHYPTLPWPRNHLFTHLVATSAPPLAVGGADQSLYILRAFGIETRNIIPELHLSKEVCLRAAKILADEGVLTLKEATAAVEESMRAKPVWKNGVVTVNPFSRWSYKEWGLEKWVRIVDWLWGEFGIDAVIVGSPAERDRADELVRACAGKVYNMAGKTTLAELAGVLKQSRLHIGVDSAAPHIAAAVGTPTVTLYGPSDWRYWAPPGKLNRVVVSDMACVPCHQKGCEGTGTSRCLETLDVATVQSAIREGLSR